jgi:hypothetical protein
MILYIGINVKTNSHLVFSRLSVLDLNQIYFLIAAHPSRSLVP